MGPIRRSRKRKSEPEPAAESEARGGKPVRSLVRASERLRTPPQSRASVPQAHIRTPPQSRAGAPQSHQVRGRRRQRVPRRVYRFLADLSSSDSKSVDMPRLTTGKKKSAILALAALNDTDEIAAKASDNQSNKIRDKSVSYLSQRVVNEDILSGPVYPDLLGCNENSQTQPKTNYFPEEKVQQQGAVLLGQSSASLLSQPSASGFDHFEYDPKLYPSSQLEVSSSHMIAMPSVPQTGHFQASLFGAFGQLRPPSQVPVLEIQSPIPDFDSTEGSNKEFTDEVVCYKRGKKVVDKSGREITRSVAISEELTNAENDNGKEVSNDATGFGKLPETNTKICSDSAPLKDNKGLHESNVQEIIPSRMMVAIHELYQDNYIGALKGATECTSTSDNPLDSNVLLSNSPTQYGNKATKADKCATSMEQDISEESFEQYLVMDDGANDDFMPSIKSCQAIGHNPHPCKDNMEAVMDCETSCVVAHESMPAMPLVMINEVVPNLFSSNTTSDMGKEDHQEYIGVPCNMAEHAGADILFSAISLPSLKVGTNNTQTSTMKFGDEEKQGTSPEHHASPMTEHPAESNQSIGTSAINQLFSTDMRNTETEHGNELTMLEYDEGTMSTYVASETDDSYCPMLQRSLVIHESTIADQPLEPLAIENSPFVKTLPMWAQIEDMEIFKKVPQRPHFHPFKCLGPELCESMALGLMVFFAKTAESIKNLNSQDKNELFKEKRKGLCLLEEHGFDVGHLRSRLETLLHMKNSRSELRDAIKKLEEKITLKEMDGRQRDTQIGMLYTAVRQFERQAKLFRCILKSSVSQQKTDALEISRLKMEACDLEQLYLSVEQQFSSVVAAPW